MSQDAKTPPGSPPTTTTTTTSFFIDRLKHEHELKEEEELDPFKNLKFNLEKAKKILDSRDKEMDRLKYKLEQAISEANRRKLQAKLYLENYEKLQQELQQITSGNPLRMTMKQEQKLKPNGILLRGDKSERQVVEEEYEQDICFLENQLLQKDNQLKESQNKNSQLEKELASYKERAEMFQKTLETKYFSQSVKNRQVDDKERKKIDQTLLNSHFDELIIQVALPKGKGVVEFVINQVDNPTEVTREFAYKYRLNKAATKVLTAFVEAECQNRYSPIM